MANLRTHQGRFREAVPLYQRALLVDPRSIDSFIPLAYTLSHLREYEEADSTWQRAIRMHPDNTFSYFLRAINTSLWKGYPAVDLVHLPDAGPSATGWRAKVALNVERYDEALEQIELLSVAYRNEGFFYPKDLLRAWVYTDRGDNDLAMESDSHFASLRQHPAYRRLVEKYR